MLILIGTRIILRQFHEGDLAWWARSLRHGSWGRWDAPWEPTPTRAEIGRMVERARLLARQRRLPPNRMVVETRGGTPIGTVTRYWVDPATEWMEVGIGLYDARHRGRGYGTEALAMWVDYLFDAMTLRRIGLRTWSGNRRMVTVARRLGFVQEARFRRAYVTRTRAYDRVAYGLLRSEWLRVRRRWAVGP